MNLQMTQVYFWRTRQLRVVADNNFRATKLHGVLRVAISCTRRIMEGYAGGILLCKQCDVLCIVMLLAHN